MTRALILVFTALLLAACGRQADKEQPPGQWFRDIARAAGIDSAVGANMAGGSTTDSNRALPAEVQEEGTLQASLDRAATVRIKSALAAAGGNRVDAAAALGVDRTTLYRLMKRLSLSDS